MDGSAVATTAPKAALVDQSAALASPVRRQILLLLRERAAGYDVFELAAAVGLHVTTVRFHLDVLRRVGLATGRRQPRASTGRPRTLYAAADSAACAPNADYETLTRLLAAHLDDDPSVRATRAEAAGLDWAAELDLSTEAAATGVAGVAEEISNAFGELGFDPELRVVGNTAQIWLRACPFRSVARAYPDVICSAHRGLLHGTLARLGAPARAGRLEPFIAPELCLASVSGDSPDDQAGGTAPITAALP